MTTSGWQEHFKNGLTKAEPLYAQNSSAESLLLFCLQKKFIPVPEYLAWARESYELPVLEDDFIQLHPPKKELFTKWHKTRAWSPEFLPVAEWDGCLIVACLEAPAPDASSPVPLVFVLASPTLLQAVWNEYQDAPVPARDAELFAEDGSLLLQEQEDPAEATVGSDDGVTPGDESPEGLLAETSSVQAPLLQDLPKAPMPPAPPPSVEAPPIGAKKGPRTSEPLTGIKLSSASSFDETKVDTVVSTVGEISLSQKKVAPTTQVTAGGEELPSAPVKPTTVQNGTAAYFLEKLRKQNTEKFDKAVQASFQQLKTFFKKSMLLGVGDKDRLIKPLLWDSNFENPPTPVPEFSLKTPSIFRIVSGTQKPYHGYIIVNDLNESFFETWNQGQIPDHVTIVPLLDGDLVVGMLLGIGEKSNYNKNVLQFTETLAKDLTQKILKPTSPSSRAA